MLEIVFEKKRPSIVQIKAALKKGIAQGHLHINVIWGENALTLEKQRQWIGHSGPWTGDGWIGKHGGQNLADQLNKELKNDRAI